jgi:hypothetical protein
VATKSRVNRSGVAAARILSNAVFIKPGECKYGSDVPTIALPNAVKFSGIAESYAIPMGEQALKIPHI